jgi:hypothetical protein
MNLDKMVGDFTKRWDSKSIAKLREEALQDANGTAFDSLRVENGTRVIIVVCTTNSKQITILENVLDFGEEIPVVDWSSFTLVDLVLRAGKNNGNTFQDCRDCDGKRTALILCGVGPEAVNMLERIFNFQFLEGYTL